MCIPESIEKQQDELLRPLDLENMHESLWNDKCDYVDPVTCDNLNQTGYNLIVLKLNICSILKHITELKTLLNVLESEIPE